MIDTYVNNKMKFKPFEKDRYQLQQEAHGPHRSPEQQ